MGPMGPMGAGKHRADGADVDAVEPEFDGSSESEGNGPPAPGTPSLTMKPMEKTKKPMEKTKKRKSMDKERRRQSDLKSDALSKKPKLDAPPTAPPPVPVAAGGGAMPELHLGLFGDLASVESSVREAAVEALGRELREVQSAYERFGEAKSRELVANVAPMEAEEKDDGFENCAPSVRYALRRLIRGVSSSRECARQGFATALAVVLATVPAISVSSVMKLIVQSLEVSSRKGQEAREGLLGRLFAFGALARSGRMAPESLLDKNTSCLKEFIGHATYLAGKKQYLQEPAVLVILDLIDKLPVESVQSHVLQSENMNKWFEKAASEKQPDALLLALKLQERFSLSGGGIFGRLLPQPFTINSFFSREHLSVLLPCFQASTFCQPRVHSLWPVIINILIPSVVSQDETIMLLSSSKKHKKAKKGSSSEDLTKNIRNFTKVVIEGSLLTSSHDRKHLAFNIILMLLPRLPAHGIHIVLSYKLIQCLMDVLSTKGTWLYNAAQHFLKGLVNWVGKDTERMVAIIVALQKHSGGRFDCITRTNTVEEFITTFKTGPACRQFIKSLIELFFDEQGLPNELSQNAEENFEKDMIESSSLMPSGSDFLKDWVISTLPRVLKNVKLCSEMKFSHEDIAAFQEEKYHLQTEVMKFLTVQGLFSASLGNEVTSFELQETLKWPKTATSTSLCRKCIEKLQFVMEDAQKGDDPRTSSTNPEKNDLVSCFVRMLRTLCNIPSISLFRTLNSEDENAFKKLQEVETRLFHEERKTEAGVAASSKLRALRYLLIQLLLQVLLWPGAFSEAASELVICCRKAFPGSFEDDVLEKEEEFDGEDSGMPDMMDVLVDILISLLPQASARMCFAIEQVFRFFCNEITDTGLLRMLRIIKKDLKSLRRQTVESDEDNEDEGDDDDDFLGVEDAEDASDVEAIDSADDDTTNMEETEQPEETEEDEEMDDEAMFRMDSHITQFLKKSKGDFDSSQVMLFKLRILSLLEIYLQRNPGTHQVFTIFSHLVWAYVNCHSEEGCKQLGERIWGILQKKIFKAKEYPRDNETEFSSLLKMLDKSLKSGSRARIKSVSLLANNSTFWILKIIHSRNFPESQVEDVARMFQDLLVDYFTCKNSRVKPGFIKEVIQRHTWISHHLFSFLLENGANAKSEFRRVEALDFVDSVMKSCVSIKKGQCEKDVSRKCKFLKKHLPQLCEMIGQVLSNLPKKQSRRASVRKFCARVFNMVSILKLNKPFLKALTPDAFSACESQLGNLFATLKNPTKE